MTGFQGVHAAAITPRGKQGEIDFGAAFDLLDHLCKGGVRGIVLFGDYGDYPSFTVEERSRLTYLAVKRSRVPVLVGVGSATMDLSVSLARDARDAGAAAVLIPPPLYYHYEPDDLIEFYQRIAGQLGSSIDAFLSNTPLSASSLTIDTALPLLQTGHFAGVEDASGSLESFSSFASAAAGNFQLLVSNDALFTRVRCGSGGAHGAISATACVVPELVVALDRAIASSKSDQVNALDGALQEFLRWEALFPKPVLVKMATGLRGLKTGNASVPLCRGKERLLNEFCEWFQGWLPAVRKMSANA